jgi:hypothetical protein
VALGARRRSTTGDKVGGGARRRKGRRGANRRAYATGRGHGWPASARCDGPVGRSSLA